MSIKKFREFLEKKDLSITVLESKKETHTTKQAAKVNNVLVQNITKPILVKIDERFVLFLSLRTQRLI